MTNDNRELTAVDPTQVGQIYPYEIEVDYPDGAHTWEKGRMNAQAVATRFRQEAERIELYGDLPNPVNTAIAAELERLLQDEQIVRARRLTKSLPWSRPEWASGLVDLAERIEARITEIQGGA